MIINLKNKYENSIIEEFVKTGLKEVFYADDKNPDILYTL